jgi:hypothetical protein
MTYPKELFEINFAFAQKIAELSKQPLESVLFDYTLFYRSFNLGRSFDPANPIWLAYLKNLRQSDDIVEFTYKFHLQRQSLTPIGGNTLSFGCFWYEVWPNRNIRIHFDNNDTSGYGPLSKMRLQVRKLELRKMFRHIKDSVEDPTTVIGRTWLYNMVAYRRLFPPIYLETAQVSDLSLAFPRIALWGQFLNNHGLIKEYLVKAFIDCLNKQRDLDSIKHCFPFQVLRLETPIQNFFDFYKVR